MSCQIAAGDRVKYKSFAGDVYDATVLAVGPDGFASLGVHIPSIKEPFELKAVRLERIKADAARD